MNPSWAFFRLIRFFNLVMIGLIVFLVRYCLVHPLSLLTEIPNCLADFQWLLLGAASVFLAASGNVINDIMDQDIDSVNKPDKQVVGKIISESKAWNIYYVFSALGIGAGVWLANSMNSEYYGAVFPMIAAMLWFYSTNFKTKPVIGNVIIASLGALLLMMPHFMEWRCQLSDEAVMAAVQHGAKMTYPWQAFIMAFAGFSFITTLIREMIKDIQDMKGDESEGANTLPIMLGFRPAKWMAIFLSIGLIAAVAYFMNLRLGAGDDYTFYYLAIAVQLPILALMLLLFTAKEPKDMAAPSGLIKGIMLMGMLSMLVLRYSFVNA